MSGSIKSNRCQPVEVAGDAAAKVRAHAGAHLAFRRTVPAPPHPTSPGSGDEAAHHRRL